MFVITYRAKRIPVESTMKAADVMAELWIADRDANIAPDTEIRVDRWDPVAEVVTGGITSFERAQIAARMRWLQLRGVGKRG